MVAKGGGSANKTYFYPMTKATIQNEGTLLPFLVEKMKSLGTAACPPYHIAFVIGGTSAEKNLLTVKLASIKFYDSLPTTGDATGRAFRDVDLEQKLLAEARKIGLGAQFGGVALAHDIRVVRLPRHGASCPIGMGVSCSADRNIKAKINRDGIWLEQMDSNPTELIPEEMRRPGEGGKGIEIDLDKGIDAVRRELTKYPVSTRVNLKGTIIVARDIAHAKLKARLDAGEDMPQYFKDHPILYAGPAKTPEGYPCGSMGPRVPGPRRIAGHDCQGQPHPRSDRRLPAPWRFLPGHHRRRGSRAVAKQHQEHRVRGVSRAGHGSHLENHR